MHRCCLFVWLSTEPVARNRGYVYCRDLNTSTKHNIPLPGNGWIIYCAALLFTGWTKHVLVILYGCHYIEACTTGFSSSLIHLILTLSSLADIECQLGHFV
ncbi:unnamed protein product [Dicrocoelium dendriticum]|nr:unnamed protein product [Dicrocoelium dendriticum]